MEYLYPASIVLSLAAGFLIKVLIDHRKNSSMDILSPGQLSELGLENCDDKLKRIFTTKSSKRRIKQAQILLEELLSKKKEWEKKVSDSQNGAESTRENIQEIMNSYAELPSKGQQANKFYMDAGPELRRLKVFGQQLSSELNALQFIDDQIMFLDHVSTGNKKLRVIDDILEKSSMLRPVDLKMNEFITSVNNTVKLSNKVMKDVDEYWANDFSVQEE